MDIGNKLVLLKTGYLYHKKKQISIDDTDDQNAGIKLYKGENMDESQRTAIYGDKSFDSTPENRAVSYKHVFKIWARQVSQAENGGNLTQ